MYLLYTLSVNQKTGFPDPIYGIRAGALERVQKAIVEDEFWGETEIILEENSDFCYKPSKKGEFTLLPYVNSYTVEDLEHGFKKFTFTVGKLNNNDLEGFIVFIKKSFTSIKTNGKKLFGRTPHEIVVVLENRQYVKFDELHFEARNSDLFYSGCI